MRFIVTRPAAQAAAWVAELQALGHEAVALPLIEIGPPTDPEPVIGCWRQLAGFDFVMFVSANAVQQFFALATGAWPGGVRAGSTGPGTSAALRRVGVPAAQIVEPPADAAAFDSEALWVRVAQEDWNGRRALVVRGEEGRDWLADTLRSRGATVDFLAAYQRRAPVLDAGGQGLLRQALVDPSAQVWLFSSSEAVGHLRQLAPQAAWSASRALASHPRIAQVARELGFGEVHLLPAPTAAAVAAWAAQGPSIQSAAP